MDMLKTVYPHKSTFAGSINILTIEIVIFIVTTTVFCNNEMKDYRKILNIETQKNNCCNCPENEAFWFYKSVVQVRPKNADEIATM